VKAAEREGTLGLGHLVVIQLHRIDGAATELIVLRVRTEDRLNRTGRGSLGCVSEWGSDTEV
jgi:hypothetical protein